MIIYLRTYYIIRGIGVSSILLQEYLNDPVGLCEYSSCCGYTRVGGEWISCRIVPTVSVCENYLAAVGKQLHIVDIVVVQPFNYQASKGKAVKVNIKPFSVLALGEPYSGGCLVALVCHSTAVDGA